jgi:hypothetical protein
MPGSSSLRRRSWRLLWRVPAMGLDPPPIAGIHSPLSPKARSHFSRASPLSESTDRLGGHEVTRLRTHFASQ